MQSRELTVCDTLDACYLVNIKTRAEVKLDGSDSLELDESNDRGYSIRCDVSGNQGAELDFIKFFYDGTTQEEFGEPRYMFGDSDAGAFINPVEYLSTCGTKTVKIEGSVWSNSCFTKEFTIDVTNSGGKPCQDEEEPSMAPVKAPVMAPVAPPVKAPVASPVKAPVMAPVKPPTPKCPYPQEWINGCCKNTCKNDFICPANSFRIPHRLCYDNFDDCQCAHGYYKSTTEGKCLPVNKPPTKAPVKAPVKPPTPVCAAGYEWINGCCKKVCTNNNYVCPANSYRKSHRECYDGFDDCECWHGYYKSAHENKCIKYSWCWW